MQRFISRHYARYSAAFSTRTEWKHSMIEGPGLQDFLTRRHRSEPTRTMTFQSSTDSLYQLRRILADIRLLVRIKSVSCKLTIVD